MPRVELERISEEEASNMARWTDADDVCRNLLRHPRTVRRWIESGRVRAARTSGRVYIRTLDLLRIVYSHPANRVRIRTCVLDARKVEISSKKSGHNSNLNRVVNRGTSRRKLPATRLGEPFAPHEAAVALQFSFRRLAEKLVPRDLFLQDDLVQEMSLVVLSSKSAAPKDYFYQMAKLHAIDYLKYERLRGFIPLDKIDEPRGVPREIPDELLVKALLEDGTKLANIEAVLEAKIVIDEAG